MHLWRLPSEIVATCEREARLVAHKHSCILVEWVETLIIIKLRHLLLHVLLMGIFLAHVSLGLLIVHGPARLAPCVASPIIVSRRKHWVLLFFFLSIVRGSPLSLFIRHIIKILIINNKFEINSSKFENSKSLLTFSELFLFFF